MGFIVGDIGSSIILIHSAMCHTITYILLDIRIGNFLYKIYIRSTTFCMCTLG